LSDYNPVDSTSGKVGLAADFERDSQEYLAIAHPRQQGLALNDSLTLIGWARLESEPSGDH
jgi:hypothetical protein